jgi:hypothetical protein|tara:strand:+ start:563 stop:736 length:174 start_codon:yes stop_codon:yes gene_type:complete
MSCDECKNYERIIGMTGGGFKNYTIKQLRNYCKKNNINIYNKEKKLLTKKELINKIK